MKKLLTGFCILVMVPFILAGQIPEGARWLDDGELALTVGQGASDTYGGFDYCAFAGGVRLGLAAAALATCVVPAAQGAAFVFASVSLLMTIGISILC
jgi:hypothetical protein